MMIHEVWLVLRRRGIDEEDIDSEVKWSKSIFTTEDEKAREDDEEDDSYSVQNE